jgi:hypothetical protein
MQSVCIYAYVMYAQLQVVLNSWQWMLSDLHCFPLVHTTRREEKSQLESCDVSINYQVVNEKSVLLEADRSVIPGCANSEPVQQETKCPLLRIIKARDKI